MHAAGELALVGGRGIARLVDVAGDTTASTRLVDGAR